MIRNMTADELVVAHANEGVIALVDSNGHRFEVEGEIAYSANGMVYVEVSLGTLYLDAGSTYTTYDVEL